MRFHLPGSSSSVDRAAVPSAEQDEDSVTRSRPIRSALSKKVKISVEGDLNRGITDTVDTPPIVNKKLQKTEETGVLAKPPIGDDPETWVSRIMHPWLDPPLCCPDQWDNYSRNHGKPPVSESLLDQLDESTMATNSFESSTPILPPFPTSTFDSKIEEEEKDLEEERECAKISSCVLGIQSRHEDLEDAFVLEEVGDNRKRTRERSPPPCSYGREEGEHFGKPRSPSAWRKKAWVPFEGKRQRNNTTAELHGIIEDDIDLESFSEYGNFAGDPSVRLAEI